ncbi:hypothetical protein [Chitiniphilus eburneus]
MSWWHMLADAHIVGAELAWVYFLLPHRAASSCAGDDLILDR